MNAPSAKASNRRSHSGFLRFLLTATFFTIYSAHADTSIHLPLEKRHPRPLRPHSSKGFPSRVRIHDPLPAPRNRLHALFRRLTRASSSFKDVDLFGGMVAVGEYYAKVQIGGQTLRVQIDTGSATLAAPLKECTHCKRGDMRYDMSQSHTGIAHYISCNHDDCDANRCSIDCGRCSSTQACCAKSNTSNCAFRLNYGDGSYAKGMLVRDEFEWGSVKFPVTFGGIASDSDDFERSEVDGILGMAYSSLACNPSCVTPTFDAMRTANPDIADKFSICITAVAGKIVLGSYDPSLSSSPESAITWVPLQLSDPPTFYSMPVTGSMTMDGKRLALPNLSRAIVDSGTTLIVLTKATFNKLRATIMEDYCDVPGLCGPETWFQAAHCTTLSDSNLNKLPTLTIPLNGFDIEMTPRDYMINFASKGQHVWCVGIMPLDAMSGGVDVILGNVVMNKYVTIYDRENRRIGFTKSDTSCGLDSSKNTGDSGSDSGSDDSGGNTGGLGGVEDGGSEGTPEQIAACGKAADCSSCANVKGYKCWWEHAENKCVPGDSIFWMCTLETLKSRMGYVIAGSVGAVVLVIVIVAVAVNGYRKRRNSAADLLEDPEAEEPLAGERDNVEAATRDAFAIDDDKI